MGAPADPVLEAVECQGGGCHEIASAGVYPSAKGVSGSQQTLIPKPLRVF